LRKSSTSLFDGIDAREKRIASELGDAEMRKAEAKKERDEFRHKNEEFDQQRAALLNKVTDEAKAERQRLLTEARKAADALSAKRQEALRIDAHNLNQAISRRTQQEVFAIALKAASDPALVRSAFDLPADQRTVIQNALNETFAAEIRVRFETSPDLVSGIELTTNGQKVAWSIADYLAALEKSVDVLLKEKDKAEAKVEPQPEEPKPAT
jgi:F-type H+-transporting ATPase subunit b